MPAVIHTNRSLADVDEIAAFTIERWGRAQAETYLDELDATCLALAERPAMGRLLRSAKHSTWRRYEFRSHVIVYAPHRAGIKIQRIVHKARLLANLIG